MFALLAVLTLLFTRIDAGLHFLRIQEGKGLGIDCGKGRAIHIIQASYGKVLGARKLCHAPSSKTEVSARCRMEQKCFLRASNYIFGDPCKGVHKRLDVLYFCYKPHPLLGRAKTFCEGKSGFLRCPRGSHIRVWQASYGRLDDAKCHRGTIHTNTCHAKSSFRRVTRACSKRNWCYLKASNSVFGDPCVGTHKYLHVVYSCVRRRHFRRRSAFTYKMSKTRVAVIREHKRGKILFCRGNGHLSILSAGYGLYLSRKCRFKATDVIKVRNRCHWSKSCFLTASNNIFGDPCKGVVKKLYVRFRCTYRVRVCRKRF